MTIGDGNQPYEHIPQVESSFASSQKKQESENKEWIKLRGVTLDNGWDRHDCDNLNEKNRRNRAIHPVCTIRPQQKCHTDYRAEHDP